MKLHHHPMSQHARRVRMLCHELGLNPQLVLVALERGEHRLASFTALNLAHAVPVLEDDGLVLAESHTIMRYLCDKHDGQRFYPRDAASRAFVDQWLDWTHCKLNPPIQTRFIQLFMFKDKADPAVLSAAEHELTDALAVLGAGLAAQRGIGGKQPTLADLAIASSLALYEATGASIDAPAVGRWYREQKRSAAFKATDPAIPSGAK